MISFGLATLPASCALKACLWLKGITLQNSPSSHQSRNRLRKRFFLTVPFSGQAAHFFISFISIVILVKSMRFFLLLKGFLVLWDWNGFLYVFLGSIFMLLYVLLETSDISDIFRALVSEKVRYRIAFKGKLML